MADGVVAADDNLIAFLQTVGDLLIIVVADADFHRHGFDVVAFDDKHHVHRLVFLIRFFVGFRGIGFAAGEPSRCARWHWSDAELVPLVLAAAVSLVGFGLSVRVVTLAMGAAMALVRVRVSIVALTDMPGRNDSPSVMRMRT